MPSKRRGGEKVLLLKISLFISAIKVDHNFEKCRDIKREFSLNVVHSCILQRTDTKLKFAYFYGLEEMLNVTRSEIYPRLLFTAIKYIMYNSTE
jgi:hypothetical protein